MDFIERFFAEPPKPPFSNQLSVEGVNTPEDIFRVLATIFTHGLQRLYGRDWTPRYREKISDYMQSLGWEVVWEPRRKTDDMLPKTLFLPGTQSPGITIAFRPLTLL